MTTKKFDIIANLGIETNTKGIEKFTSKLSRFTSGLTKFNDGLKKIAKGAAVAGVAIAGAIAGTVIATRKVTDEMATQENIARGLGVAGEDMRALGFALGTVGLEASDVTMSIKSMNETLGRFKIRPTEKLKKVFESLNLDSKKLMSLNPAQQFEFILDSAQKIGDDQKAQAALSQIFGGKGSDLAIAIKNAQKSIGELREDGKKLDFQNQKGTAGAVAFKSVMDDFGAIISSLKNQFFGLMGGALTPMVNKFNEFMLVNKELIQLKLEKFFVDFAKNLEKIWIYISDEKNQKAFVEGIKKIGEAILIVSDTIIKLNNSGGLKALLIGTAIFGGLATVAGWILKIIGLVKFLLPLFTIIGKAILAINGPIAILVGTIAFSFYSIYKTISENASFIKALWGELWDYVGKKIGDAADWFVEKWQKVKDFFSDLYTTYIQPIITGISSIGDGIGRFFGGASASAENQSFRRGGDVISRAPRAIQPGLTNVKNDVSLNFGSTNSSPLEISRQVERTMTKVAKKSFAGATSGIE